MTGATQSLAAPGEPGSESRLLHDIEWRISAGQVPYPEALQAMEERSALIRDARARERVWLIEHPPLYTAGTSADPSELFNPEGFPVYAAGRGGRYTYHGPGQRVVYVQLDLDRRGRDVRAYVHALEGWVIDTLDRLGIKAWRAPGRIGIWTDRDGQEAKLGAIGVRVRRWVTMHGFAVNLAPKLSHFSGIVPCGIANFPVTSLAEMETAISVAHFDAALEDGLGVFLSSLGTGSGKG